MNPTPLISAGFALCAALAMTPAQAVETSQVATQFDFSSETTPGARKFYFETVPGHRYTLWRSADLEIWTAVPGYPKTADGLSMEHTFAQGVKEFFRIEAHDDQAPEIIEQFPGADGFAVRRFDDLRFVLDDATGIDPASIRLAVGGGAELAVGAAGLAFADNVLTYDSGDTALGAYGAEVPVTLTVADTLGHILSHSFTFTLEVEPKVVANLYVFGSPAAQRMGQRLPDSPTAALGRQTGPVRMDGADPWEIAAVQPDRIILTYTGETAPVFAAGTYLANLTPVTLGEVFYREVLSSADDAAGKQLTLMTQDVPLAEIAEEGSVSFSPDSAVFDLAEDGGIQPAAELGFNLTFPRMGIDLDDEGPLALPGNPKFGVSLYKANAWVTPSLECAIETKGFSVRRAAIQARADIEGTLIPEITYRLTGDDEKKKEYSLHKPVGKLVMVGAIGWLPVWLDFSYSTKLKLEAEANAAVILRFGWSRNASFSAGAAYAKDASPRLSWTRNSTVSPLKVEPVSLSLGGTLKAKASLVPQFDVRLESLLGFYVNADPRAEFEITADGGLYISGVDGKIQMNPGGHATLTRGIFADLNAGLSIIGVDQDYLPAMEPLRIFSRGWELEFPDTPLAFTSPAAPQAVSVNLGDSLNLEGSASGGKGPVYYQWLFNGMLMPGQTSPQLSIPRCTAGNAGSYTLRARAGTLADLETVVSPAFSVTVTGPGAAPDGFALIPAGSFEMGDQLNPSVVYRDERPVHTVYVSAFFIGKHEVTKELWDSVRAWGLNNGYTDLPAGGGKAANHPVHSITWYDMVKWCNARSEKEGLTPCYKGAEVLPPEQYDLTIDPPGMTIWNPSQIAGRSVFVSEGDDLLWLSFGETVVVPFLNIDGVLQPAGTHGSQSSGATWVWPELVGPGILLVDPPFPTYRFGVADPVCNWIANGYRLPTEAEWEKAARGGLGGKNFPWGNTITHSQANYYSNSSYSFDVSPTPGYHPTYNVGGEPYSSPIGSFAPNGYGLYDMAGNIREWCWDWLGSYEAWYQSDPRGPSSGFFYRVYRGGSWNSNGNSCRAASRESYHLADSRNLGIGFRLARSSVP